ncbi:MAG: FKBP-type peptidyl-prolyl cis-trans isomerase [Gammaproteobacteria bacterium]|nr:FKBP-type peptidyl-prolyl cis-trans isomerase [Gammaproteobacteria bacterium]MDH3767959.1 FKBP-type peptidyl-prolyl cis-trans isomerase [Gammaproteobacteria bacterium]
MIRLCLIIIATASMAACAKIPAESPAPELATDEDKTVYALGLAIAQSLEQYDLSANELALLKSGLTDGVSGHETAVDLQEYREKLSEFGRGRAQAAMERNKSAATEYHAKMAAESGAQTFDSGLIMFELVAGDGPQPAATDTVEVHYHGTLPDGTVFDSSVERGTPTKFPLNRVIACWTEGVQQIKVGGKSRLVCPSDIAYGDHGKPPTIPPAATLIFEVELLGIG